MSSEQVVSHRPYADKAVKGHHRKMRATRYHPRKKRKLWLVPPPAFFTVLLYDPQQSVNEVQELTILIDYKSHCRTTLTPSSKRILPTIKSASTEDLTVCINEGSVTSSKSLEQLDVNEIEEFLDQCSYHSNSSDIIEDIMALESFTSLVMDESDVVNWKNTP